MQYLGRLHGAGVLTYGDVAIARANYDLDGFLAKPGYVTSAGEISAPHETLKKVFGRNGVQLQTDDGRVFNLRFTEKKLSVGSGAASVDVNGDLPPAAEWRV
jgi:hypothetical protein